MEEDLVELDIAPIQMAQVGVEQQTFEWMILLMGGFLLRLGVVGTQDSKLIRAGYLEVAMAEPQTEG